MKISSITINRNIANITMIIFTITLNRKKEYYLKAQREN